MHNNKLFSWFVAWCMLASTTVIAADRPPVRVTVSPVSVLETAAQNWTPGTVLSRTDANIGTEVAGIVDQVLDAGTQVKAGDQLVALDSSLWDLTVKDNVARVRALEQRREFLRSEAKRMQSLAQVNSAARSQLEEAVANRNVISEEIVQARANLARSEYLLAHTVVTAPFAGQIVERLAEPGEYVAIGQAVARLVDLQDLEIRVRAPLRVAPFVEVGAMLPVRIGKKILELPVNAVIPVGNLESRSFELRLRWQTDPIAIGTPLQVGLPTSGRRQILTVPRDAMVLREIGASVFKVVDETVVRVPITTGIGAQNRIEVISERLSAGDAVVVQGAEFLRDGQQVAYD